MKPRKTAVLGAGSWGTALAMVSALHAETVALWGRDEETCAAINSQRQNPRYLPGVPLDPRIAASTRLAQVLEGADLLVIGLPTKSIAAVLGPARDLIGESLPVISTSKGICPETLRFPSEIVRESLGRAGKDAIFVLSGPSFARETARKCPTAVTFAGTSMSRAEECGQLFFAPHFRTYPSADMAGVEAAGAAKNVIAMAAGVSDALGLGTNARSALITRGLAEIIRLGRQFGADPMTFLGLAGVGDLVLTCTGGLSRNRALGGLLAEGKTLAQGLKELGTVEGVETARSLKAIADQHGIDMPISAAVYEVLFEGKTPQQAVLDLMTRPMRSEA